MFRIPITTILLSYALISAQIPQAPQDLRSWPVSESEIVVHWTVVMDSQSTILLERSLGFQGEWEIIEENLAPQTTEYQDSNLDPETIYSYRIRVTNNQGSDISNLARAITDDGPYGKRTLLFQNGINGYHQATDVGIDSTRPNLSDHSPFVWVEFNSPSDEKQALLQFQDLFGDSPNQIPHNAPVTNAYLRVFLPFNTRAGTKDYIYFHRMKISWDQNFRWNSPEWNGNGVRHNDQEAAAEYDGSKIFSLPGLEYEVDLTTSLQAWATGESNYGWLIRNGIEDNYYYGTTHNNQINRRPMLAVQFDTDPQNNYPVVEAIATESTGYESSILDLTVSDPDNDPLTITLYGRKAPIADPDFSVIILPDTQYYVSSRHGGNRQMFNTQIDWIVENREALNIAFVLHVGDIVENGDIIRGSDAPNLLEWAYAADAMYRLENPETTGLPEGIPYGVVVGNHDQEPLNDPDGDTYYYNRFFGYEHFKSKSYYGGHYGDNNDNYYQLYEVGTYKFIGISLEFRTTANADILNWADELLKRYPDRRGIINTHYAVRPGVPAPWGPYGEAIYNALRNNPNFHLMVGGHITGEGHRTDVHGGNTVHSILQNYQFSGNGGNGLLRILTFSPKYNEIRAQTYSPWSGEYWTGEYSQFTLRYDMGTIDTPFEELASFAVSSSGHIQYHWENLDSASEYDWYAVISDGRKSITSAIQTIRTALHPYDEWALQHFDADDPDSDPDSDPDRDGYPNLLEYLLGRNPLGATEDLDFPKFNQDGNHWTVKFRKRRHAHMTIGYELSKNLFDWYSGENAPFTVTESVNLIDDALEEVRLEIDGAEGNLFLRFNAQ